MKRFFFLFITFLCDYNAQTQGIGIGTTTPDNSAILDVYSTVKGFLPPRMTAVQRNAIPSPAAGLIVYCLDCGVNGGEPQYYNGTAWVNMIGGTTLGNNTTKTKTELLTQKLWMYDYIFNNYNLANTVVIYKRGKSINLQNYDLSNAKFNTDGTYTERTSNGSTINGTWRFLNNETQIETKHSQGTYVTNIIELTEDAYIWYDAVQSNGIYARCIN